MFYLKYDMYRNNFPLIALATYTNAREGIFRSNHVQARAAARNRYYPVLKKFAPQLTTAVCGMLGVTEGQLS